MPNDEQEIRELVATWMAATKAGDKETVLNLMADDVVFLLPGRPPMVGKSEFAEAAAQAQSNQGPAQFDGSSEIQEIKVLGDWAFMWTKLTVAVTPPGGAAANASGTHAFHTQKTKRQMGLGARRQHARACVN